MTETSDHRENTEPAGAERACAYRVLRYTPNLVRDEWVNIGVLVFDPQSGERRLRMIEEEEEFRPVRGLHPGADLRPLDYSYRRNGARGFVQTLSVTRAPADAKLFAYPAERITAKASLKTEFAAVTDVALNAGNERHRFVRDTLRGAGIEPIPMEGFAVWVAKLKPSLQ